MTVPASTIFGMFLLAFVSCLLPSIVFILLRPKLGVTFRIYLAGMAGGYLLAVLMKNAAAILLYRFEGVYTFFTASPALYATYVGLLVILEESGRFGIFHIMHKRQVEPSHLAFSFGLGYGALEALLLVGLDAALSVSIAFSLNQQGLAAVMESLANPEAEATLLALAATPAGIYLAQTVERIAVLAFHVAASVLIWIAASRQGPLFLYPLAAILHPLFCIPIAFYQFGAIQSIWLAALVALILSAASCVVSYRVWIVCRKPVV